MRELVRVAADASTFPGALARALAGGGPAIAPTPVSDGGLRAGGGRGESAIADTAPPLPARVDDRVALVIETSGSTSAPKRVALSVEAIQASARATHAALGGPGQWMLALPVHYVAGAMVVARAIDAGTDLVVSGRRTAGIIAGIRQMNASSRRYAAIVPSQLDDLLRGAEADPAVASIARRIDAYLVGGQRTDERLLDMASAHGITVVRTYGSSETAGGCIYDGRPIGDTRVRIDEDGRISLSSASLAEGYLDPEQTRAAFETDPSGIRWWRSSDLGAVDAAGFLVVHGRADDMIISGGVKVSLGEAEGVIRALPGMGSAVAVAVADPHWGQSFVVFADAKVREVEARDAGVALTVRELRAILAARLGAACRPGDLVWLPDGVPQTSTGKPDRRKLREIAGRMEASETSGKDGET